MIQDSLKNGSVIVSLLLVLSPCFLSRTFAANPTTDVSAIELEIESDRLALQWRRDSIQTSIRNLSQAAAYWESKKNTPDWARCTRKVARYELVLGNHLSAKNLLLNELRIIENSDLYGEKAIALANLSNLFLYYGDDEMSREYLNRALNTSEKSDNPAAVAEANFSAGEYYYAKNDLTKAVFFLELAQKHFNQFNNHEGLARVQLTLGYVYLKKNDFESALRVLEQSQTNSEISGDVRGEALSHQAIGKTYIVMTENRKAFDQLRRAEALYPDDLDLSANAALLNAISQLYSQYGDFELAMNYRIRALDFFKKENHKYGQLGTISDLSELLYSSGEIDASERYLKEGEKIARELNDEFNLARIYEHFGKVCFLKAEYEKALAYLSKALVFFGKKKAVRQGFRVKESMGRALLQLNRRVSGRTALSESFEFSMVINDRYSQSDILFQLARLNRLENDLESALDLTTRSIALTDSLYNDVANSKLQSSYNSSVYDRYQLFIDLLMQKHKQLPHENYSIRALQATERSRTRGLLETLALSDADFMADADPSAVEKEKEIRTSLNVKSDQLTDLLSRKADKTETDKLDGEINELQHQLQEIKGGLKEKSPIYSAIKNPAPFDVGEFQSQVLDDNSLLLEFSLGKEESYLWVVGKSTFDSYVLQGREQIESRIEKLRSLLNQGSMLPNEAVDVFQKRVADAEAEYSQEARALSSELLGQAANKLAGKRLIVVADGKIHYFPLAALPVPNSESDNPILLTNEVVYAPSAAALILIKKISAAGKVAEKDLFLVSDPVYSKLDDRLEQNGGANNTGFVANILGNFRSFDSLESLPRLPASLEEAKSITDVVGSAVTTGHTGFAANRENVLNAGIGDYKVIHFATHGLLDEKRPELSGIALSLFDEAGKQQDGGFIRLQDVYGMNLSADLVVLSACDTGLGKEIKGEGLMSLNNAFLQAGAKSVVSSLWKVDDTVTKVLMTDFYNGITSENLTTSAALRQAQIKLRNDPRFSSPFYWASFTAQGNFNAAPKLSRSYNAWIFAIGISLISLCGIYWLRRSRNRKSG